MLPPRSRYHKKLLVQSELHNARAKNNLLLMLYFSTRPTHSFQKNADSLNSAGKKSNSFRPWPETLSLSQDVLVIRGIHNCELRPMFFHNRKNVLRILLRLSNWLLGKHFFSLLHVTKTRAVNLCVDSWHLRDGTFGFKTPSVVTTSAMHSTSSMFLVEYTFHNISHQNCFDALEISLLHWKENFKKKNCDCLSTFLAFRSFDTPRRDVVHLSDSGNPINVLHLMTPSSMAVVNDPNVAATHQDMCTVTPHGHSL